MTDNKVVGINEESEAVVKALNPDDVLKGAMGEYRSLIILGYDKDDYLSMRASANMRRADVNWVLDRAKTLILDD